MYQQPSNQGERRVAGGRGLCSSGSSPVSTHVYFPVSSFLLMRFRSAAAARSREPVWVCLCRGGAAGAGRQRLQRLPNTTFIPQSGSEKQESSSSRRRAVAYARRVGVHATVGSSSVLETVGRNGSSTVIPNEQRPRHLSALTLSRVICQHGLTFRATALQPRCDHRTVSPFLTDDTSPLTRFCTHLKHKTDGSRSRGSRERGLAAGVPGINVDISADVPRV
uniref:Uncharacterized protein n=1 Tax=Knipowitschia caucasica TaxID=637954 RepID=A0AAV2KSE5_KNICA